MKSIVDVLNLIAPPWVYRATTGSAGLDSALSEFKKGDGNFVCVFDARKIRSINELYREFATGLNFPDYFGFNPPAFDECLQDLSWLGSDWMGPSGICLVILNAECFLVEDMPQVEWVVDAFHQAGVKWNTPVEKGEWWDRPPVPYHVIFHSGDDSESQLITEIRELPRLE